MNAFITKLTKADEIELDFVMGLIPLKEACSSGQVWVLLQMLGVLTRGESFVTSCHWNNLLENYDPRAMTLI